MYRNILPYNSHNDNSNLQGHNDMGDRGQLSHLRRSPFYPLSRALHHGVRRAGNALRRTLRSESTRPSMSWWD